MVLKKIVIAALVFALSSHVITRTVSDEELYLQGNSFYLQGDYDKALSRYQDIKRKGPAVLHNMGNCYSYLSNYPVDAIVFWRQAQREAGYQAFDDLERVIKQAKQSYYKQEHSNQDNKKEIQGLERLFSPYPLLWLQIIFLFLWYLLFLLFYGLFYRKKSGQQRAPFSSRVITGFSGGLASWFTSVLYLCILGCVIFFGVGLSVGMWLKSKEQRYQRAVVAQAGAVLHVGPQDKFQKIAELELLDELWVEKQIKGWCKVVVDKNKIVDKNSDLGKKSSLLSSVGWIEESSIKIIN